ncbi:unnamed protein product [Cunninghamella blakesleeana]
MALPLEIIKLILEQLTKTDLIYLLKNPPNYYWFTAAAGIYYRQLKFNNHKQLLACYNLFQQTQRQREKSDTIGFYSSFNYSHFVKILDLSLVPEKYHIDKHIILQLSIDCYSLITLNLYNCFLLDNKTLSTILPHLTQLENLSIEGCNYININPFLNKKVQSALRHLKSLNICLIPYFFTFEQEYINPNENNVDHSPLPISFPALKELKLGDLNSGPSTWFQSFMKGCSSIKSFYLQNMSRDQLLDCLRLLKPNLRSITLYMCTINNQSFYLLATQKKITSITIKRCKYYVSLESSKSSPPSERLLFQSLLALNYRHVKELNFKYTNIPLEVTSSLINQLPAYELTKFISPTKMDLSILQKINVKLFPLTHLTLMIAPSNQLIIDTLHAILKTCHSTLMWLEIHFQSTLPSQPSVTINSEVKETNEQKLMIHLFSWPIQNQLQVLRFSNMTLQLSLEHIRRLSQCFSHVRYVKFNISKSIGSIKLKKLVNSSWPDLCGFNIENWDQIQSYENYQGDDRWNWYIHHYQNNNPQYSTNSII